MTGDGNSDSAYVVNASWLVTPFLIEPQENPEIDSVIVPLKRAGRLFFLDASVDNIQGNLIFDTGAMGLVLNATYFKNYVRKNIQSTAGITGAVSDAAVITANEMKIGELKHKLVTANLVDLSHIENRRGIKVLGLIGFEKIKEFEINIDLSNQIIRLYRIDKEGIRTVAARADHFKPDQVQNIEIINGIIFVNVKIGGKTLRFCLDSAAETNALSNSVPKQVMDKFIITRSARLNGAGAQSKEVLFGKFSDFRIGDTPLDSMTAILSNLEHLSDAYGVHIDGILGFDFFAKSVIRLNYVTKQMSIQFTKPEEK